MLYLEQPHLVSMATRRLNEREMEREEDAGRSGRGEGLDLLSRLVAVAP